MRILLFSILVLSLAACSEGTFDAAATAADTCATCADTAAEIVGSPEVDGGPKMDQLTFPTADVAGEDDAGMEEAYDSGSESTDAVDSSEPDIPSPEDAGTPEESPYIIGAGFNGELPPYSAPIDAFAEVLDQSGAPVGVDELTGSWTVLWFFPKASTFG